VFMAVLLVAVVLSDPPRHYVVLIHFDGATKLILSEISSCHSLPDFFSRYPPTFPLANISGLKDVYNVCLRIDSGRRVDCIGSRCHCIWSREYSFLVRSHILPLKTDFVADTWRAKPFVYDRLYEGEFDCSMEISRIRLHSWL
jgi:hypothetical protein